MNEYQILLLICGVVILSSGFAAIYVSILIHNEEKHAGGQKRREELMVRCKFACTWKSPGDPVRGDAVSSITLSPVYSGSDENKQFFNATPGGQIQFYTVNKAAADQFEIGKEYYVDFTLAEPKAEALAAPAEEPAEPA